MKPNLAGALPQRLDFHIVSNPSKYLPIRTMKTLQAIATSSKETPEGSPGYVMVYCSRDMPGAVRDAVLGFVHSADAGGEAIVSTKTVEADGASWLLLNRIAASGDGHVSHTLAFRDDELAQDHLGALMGEMKLDFAEKMQEKSGDEKKQLEAIISEFRREVTALQNRVNEYSNAKWWHFGGEEEIKRRRRDIDQVERAAKASAEDLVKEYRGNTSSVLRALPDARNSGKDGASAEPSCFPELLGKFEKLADDYRELSKIVSICDLTNITEKSVAELTAENENLTEQIAVARRELDVSKISDKIMSSKMKRNRKENARANAGKSSMISWQTTVIILLSLAVAALLVMEFLKDRDDAGISADLAESTKQIELQEMEWGKERKALNDQIRKLQTDSKALEAKIKTQDSGN
jgi:hypothetical protein